MENTYENNLSVLLAPLETETIVEELTQHMLSLIYLQEHEGHDMTSQILQCEESLEYYKGQYRILCN